MDRGVFLVTDTVPGDFLAKLKNLHFTLDYHPEYSNQQLAENIHKFTGIVTNSYMDLGKEMLQKATTLKYILRPGSGLDNIDLAFAKEKGILVLSSPEANSNAVAEHAIGLLLSLFNNIHLAFDEMKNHIWRRQENTGIELSGKTVGIIGYGNTGTAMAEKLSGFGVRILVYDKYKTAFGNENVEEVSLEKIKDEADIISFHIPLNAETKYLVNADFISSFKKNFYLINTSRGGVVNLSALLKGIANGKISGAAIDVLENEKMHSYTEADFKLFDDLINTKKVIITPHIAGWTKEARRNIFMFVVEKLEGYLEVKPPQQGSGT
ncbi:MAG: phosphoglycerate dehydrogenase [Bacteroidetes bacterium]|nr:phosphoglycerate dehydrogenase [Bacteroidota bacterium]